MNKSKLNGSNTVFFSTSDNSYILYAATSLLSIRKFIPEANLYILGKNISRKNQKFLKRRHINFINLDLTYLFFQTWDYPIECYYLFAGPKIFHKLGFKYSVYIDGDILCLGDPLKNCPNLSDIGGVAVNTFSELFSNEKSTIAEISNANLKDFNSKRLNSGIIYMNNSRLAELNFLEKNGRLFLECWEKGIPRKGDDSLFALFQLSQKNSLSFTALPDYYNYIPHYKGFQTDPKIIFFHFSLDKPWKSHPYRHQDKNQNIYNIYTKKWRAGCRKCSFARYLKTFYLISFLGKGLNKISSLPKRFYFVVKGLRYPIFKKYFNLKKPPIKLYWWQPYHINNFGDIVSSQIILKIFGRTSTFAPLESCDLMATGSIIELLQQTKRKNKLYVWGSGFIRQDGATNHLDRAIFKAVRGGKTLSRLKINIPTGDPGILINSAYTLFRKRHSHKIGVIIHYADMQTRLAQKFCEDSRFTVISPLDTPENVARQISECGLVLSSSLHGLIFADSLSIPNFHIKLSNNLTGGEYKFKDYCSGVNKKYIPADINRIFDDAYLAKLKKSYKKIPHLTKIQRRLIKSFPFK